MVNQNQQSQTPKIDRYLQIAQDPNKANILDLTWSGVAKSGYSNQTKIEEFKRRILRTVGSDYQRRMSQIIDNILEQTKTKNINDSTILNKTNAQQLEGILGEIQGTFYLSLLVQDITEDYNPKKVKWNGGIPAGGKQPHRDVIVDQFGIQIKNTINDLSKDLHTNAISFWSGNFDNFFFRLGITDDTIMRIFKNYYGTIVFNQPYIKITNEEGTEYVQAKQSGDSVFDPARAELEGLQPQIDALLSVCTAALMYMDVDHQLKEDTREDHNVLYILGGVAAVTASEVIQKTLDKYDAYIKNGATNLSDLTTNLSVTASSSSSEGKFNIVNALNNKDKTQNYGDQVFNNIVLRSSYIFDLSDKF